MTQAEKKELAFIKLGKEYNMVNIYDTNDVLSVVMSNLSDMEHEFTHGMEDMARKRVVELKEFVSKAKNIERKATFNLL